MSTSPEAEDRVRSEALNGRHDAALELALAAYGGELRSFLRAFTCDQDQAREAFSDLVEGLWKGLPGFRWECSFRTWAYLLARRTVLRHQEARARMARLNGDGDPAQVPWQGRSSTQPWLQTNVKARFRGLRERLCFEEQQILVLRVDRQMSWTDVARVMDGTGLEESADLAARAAALRQRFHTIKERLRALAREEGLIAGDGR